MPPSLLDYQCRATFVGHRDRHLGLVQKELIDSFACTYPCIVIVDNQQTIHAHPRVEKLQALQRWFEQIRIQADEGKCRRTKT